MVEVEQGRRRPSKLEEKRLEKAIRSAFLAIFV